MKAIFLTTLVVLLTLIASGQNSKKLSKRQKADTTTEKIINDNCCCKTDSTCIIDGKIVKTKDIVVDFRSKDIGLYDFLKRIRKGEYIRVKVINYNPYLYKVSINATDSSVAAPVDLSFLPKFLDPTNLSTFVSGLTTNLGIAPTTTLFTLENLIATLSEISDSTYHVSDCLKKKIAKNKKQVIDTSETIKCLNVFYKKVAVIVQLLDLQIAGFNDEIDETNFEFVRKFSVQRNLYPDCNSFSKTELTSYAEEIKTKFSEFRDGLATLRMLIQEQAKNYEDSIAKFSDLIAGIPSLKTNDNYVRKFFQGADSSLSKFKEAISYKSLAEMMANLENLIIPSSCFTSLPIFISDDVKKITIDLKSRADSLGLADYNTTLVIPPFQQKVWGVSGGIFITSLKNVSYGIKTMPPSGSVTDTTYDLVKDGNGNIQFGINGLAYTGWKLKYGSNAPDYFGVCFGAGMSIESKPKPRILLGGSFISGEKNRLMISAGIIAGNVRRLSNAFESTKGFKSAPVDFLKDEMKTNWFLSINYSFLSK